MQSLQMRWPVPGHIGLSTAMSAMAASELARLPHRVHLADLLLERAAGERDADGVLLQRPGLGVDHALAARVLLAVVAEHAVLDLGFDLAAAHAPIGEREAQAAAGARARGRRRARASRDRGAPSRRGASQSSVLGDVHARPAAHGIVRVGAARGEPRLERVERERDGAPSARRRHLRPRRGARRQGSHRDRAWTLRARLAQLVGPLARRRAFAALRATSSISMSGRAAVAIVRSSSVVPPTGAGVIACSAAFATAAALSSPQRPGLAGARRAGPASSRSPCGSATAGRRCAPSRGNARARPRCRRALPTKRPT